MKKEHAVAVSLAVGLILSVIMGCIQAESQKELAEKIVRLHVIANSDSGKDQQLKLKVRDAVLECRIDGIPSEGDMLKLRHTALECLRENGCFQNVQVTMENIYFDTKHYEGFALPAGYYDAVRVVIGEGKGRNWWCVIYPSLCTSFAEAEEVLSDEEISYIRRDGKKYIVRFKLQEMISKLSKNFLKNSVDNGGGMW